MAADLRKVCAVPDRSRTIEPADPGCVKRKSDDGHAGSYGKRQHCRSWIPPIAPSAIEAANMVYKGLIGYRDDYVEHIRNGRCTCTYNTAWFPVSRSVLPNVDIPGYVALVEEGRYADAIRLIRKDNPFPTTCGFICEHPCEARCRRNMVDDVGQHQRTQAVCGGLRRLCGSAGMCSVNGKEGRCPRRAVPVV